MSSALSSALWPPSSRYTHEQLSHSRENPDAIKGMFLLLTEQSMYKTLGLSAHLDWARLAIDRTKEQTKYPGAAQTDDGGPSTSQKVDRRGA